MTRKVLTLPISRIPGLCTSCPLVHGMDRCCSDIPVAPRTSPGSLKFFVPLARGYLSFNGLWTVLAFAVACCLTLSTSGCGTSVSISTSQGFVQVTPGTVDFGDVGIGQSAVSSIAITNPSPQSIVISQVNISGNAFSVAGPPQLPIQIPAGGTLALKIGFTPLSAASYSGSLTISSNSTTGGTAQVALTGTGTATASPQLAVSTSSLSFGRVTVNTAKTQTLTLTSTGTSAVTVSSAAIAGAGFTLVGGTLPATLAPNQAETLQVQFDPATAGAMTGSLTISSNSTTGGTATVALSGTGTAAAGPQTASNPQLAVSATSLSFGSVTVNTAKTQTLTLTSTGTSAVTVNSAAITGAGFTLVGGMLPATLAPNQTLTLLVQFDPATAASLTGSLTISSNSTTGSTAQVALSGTGTAAARPQLAVSTTSLNFGSVTVNTAKTQTLTLTSTGTSAVTVNSATITGAGFTLVGGALPATLSPNQTLTLQVQFDPTTAAALTGSLTISSNSTTGGTAQVALSGTGRAAASPQLAVSATSLNFGSDTVNTGKTLTLTLTSTGTLAVTVNSGAITGSGFTITGGTLPATLAPNQTLTLQVQFKPPTTGALIGQLAISSNSTTGSTAQVALSGTGTAAASPQLAVSTTSLNFGSQTVNTAKTQTLTLTSTGTSAVTVNSAAITGAGFTIVAASFPVTLTPGQSLTLQIQFDPATAAALTGTLTISSNSTTGSTATVALSGTGAASTDPQLAVSTTTLNFGSQTVNTAKTLTLTLTSTGTSAVTVNSAAITGAGFTLVGGTLPATLSPNQTLTLQVQFDPTTAAALTGTLTISSNSTTGSTATVALSGTGTAVTYSVDLSWTAPVNSPVLVIGYNIYRMISGGTLALLNSSTDSATDYVDSTVANGTTYNYVVKSVDSGGGESVASNEITVVIP